MIRVILIAVLSADGFIAQTTDQLADWSSKEDKKLFVKLTKEAGVMVMGGTTYRTIGKALPGRRNIVYSRQPIEEPHIETTQEPPQTLLTRLESEGHDTVAICGGASVYGMFLAAGLVDELYLSIEPLLFGTGVSLANHVLDTKLKLFASNQLNETTILLHYEVQH